MRGRRLPRACHSQRSPVRQVLDDGAYQAPTAPLSPGGWRPRPVTLRSSPSLHRARNRKSESLVGKSFTGGRSRGRLLVRPSRLLSFGTASSRDRGGRHHFCLRCFPSAGCVRVASVRVVFARIISRRIASGHIFYLCAASARPLPSDHIRTRPFPPRSFHAPPSVRSHPYAPLPSAPLLRVPSVGSHSGGLPPPVVPPRVSLSSPSPLCAPLSSASASFCWRFPTCAYMSGMAMRTFCLSSRRTRGPSSS